LVRAATLGHLDRIEETHDTAANLIQKYPSLSLAGHELLVSIVRAEDRTRYLEGLRKARACRDDGSGYRAAGDGLLRLGPLPEP
jgi:hypothetical protein